MTKIYLLLIVFVSAISCTSINSTVKHDNLFQVSTIDALLNGVYDSDFTISKLKGYGDFGIGTFEGVDGEMVMLDGNVYKVRGDGKVLPVSDEVTPFASVHYFKEDFSFIVDHEINSLEDLYKYIDSKIGSKNLFYAVKIVGKFEYVKTRSVPKAVKPYEKLAYIVKRQAVFNIENSEGTLLGYRLPVFAGKVNVPGYHLHFLDKSKTSGGHVLGVKFKNAVVYIDVIDQFSMKLLKSEDFLSIDLASDMQEQLKKVEKDTEKK